MAYTTEQRQRWRILHTQAEDLTNEAEDIVGAMGEITLGEASGIDPLEMLQEMREFRKHWSDLCDKVAREIEDASPFEEVEDDE